MSRLPIKDETTTQEGENVCFIEELPVTRHTVAMTTRRLSLLRKVVDYVKTGWPGQCEDQEILAFLKEDTNSVSKVVSYSGK